MKIDKLDKGTQTNNIFELPDPEDFMDMDTEDPTQDSFEQLLVPNSNNRTIDEEIIEFHEWFLPFNET